MASVSFDKAFKVKHFTVFATLYVDERVENMAPPDAGPRGRRLCPALVQRSHMTPIGRKFPCVMRRRDQLESRA